MAGLRHVPDSQECFLVPTMPEDSEAVEYLMEHHQLCENPFEPGHQYPKPCATVIRDKICNVAERLRQRKVQAINKENQ